MDRQAKIREIIKRVARKDASPAAGDSLFESGVIDSFALPDLVSELEREFSIQVPDADLTPRKFETIEKIEQYLDSSRS